MKLIDHISNNNEVLIQLSLKELSALKNALNEICNGPHSIDISEFETRVGLPLKQCKELLTMSEQIVRALDQSYYVYK